MRKGLMLLVLGAVVSTAGVARAQTDVTASVYGAFTAKSDGNGVTQSPSNAAGALFEVRHIKNPLVGFEATYAFNRANQSYTSDSLVTCGAPCGNIGYRFSTHVPGNAHEITADWLASFKLLNLRPFVLAGGGVLLNVPSASVSTGGNETTSTQTQAKGVLVYGGGLDYGVLPHLGLRFQYRGNVYKAAQLAKGFSSSGQFVHTAEPVIGAYFRF
ncbi:opacity protein-like surface antigen [Granulicella aggregans]|uniref:Opacity protein-like surface antigen n=1 Tax=Granulicella aggregans TaxID=474949 RepID=A0A7W8E6B7_9BACT|nr:outer membrane beta-barrel protein [Granulicella aggregans]MBB5060169.1 opacity protein-like surface antigen [Granulicella aggregans]